MLKYAIVLPTGSGKTTLSQKYNFFIDIDSLHSIEFREELKEQYSQALKTGDWEFYNKFECDWIFPKLLVHSSEKAKILNLNILGSFKTSYKTTLRVVESRGLERGALTKLNWETTQDAIILETHDDIEEAVLNCASRIK